MDASNSESNVHYGLDSQRDFEDFCEAVIRQTVDPDLLLHRVVGQLTTATG